VLQLFSCPAVRGRLIGNRSVGLDLDGQLIECAIAADLQQVMRRQLRMPQEELLDLAGKHVDAADDEHVIGSPGNLCPASHRS
jgi:hypothetical protein